MKQITVAAGVVYDAEGRVLLAQRPPGSHQENWWEFPGGKLEVGETPHVALERELQEELGIRVLASRPLMSIRHQYSDREVHLLVREVLRYQGEPYGAESQELAWVGAQELQQWEILPADKPVLRALGLPHQYMITPDFAGLNRQQLEQKLWPGLELALEQGIRLVQLRLSEMTSEDLRQIAVAALQRVRSAGARLMLNSDWQLAEAIGADGVHLTASQLMSMTTRPAALPLVAASVHDADELAAAERLDCDFACVSPVRKTASHPTAKLLNWHGLKSLCEQANLPVFALGGVRLEDFDQAREAGAVGIAGIRGFWPSR